MYDTIKTTVIVMYWTDGLQDLRERSVPQRVATDPLDAAGLTALMEITAGVPDIAVAVIDGPVVADHPDLASETIHPLSPANGGTLLAVKGAATAHGTYVAGILAARSNH